MSLEVLIIDNKTVDRSIEIEILKSLDVTVRREQIDSQEELIAATEGAEGIIISAHVPASREFFESASSVQVVGRAGIGIDNIDLSAANEHGVTVLHVPDYCIEEVSTHAFGLLLACGRKLPVYNSQIRSGSWDWKDGQPIHRTTNWVLGLVGFGSIARRVAEKANEFGMEILAYDPYIENDIIQEYGVQKVSLDQLLTQSTAVSIHAPLTPETKGLFNEATLHSMNENSIFINTARGEIVNEGALYNAVKTGPIGAAGIDVMVQEPTFDSNLFELENVIVTPHTAWYSEEAQIDVSKQIARDVGGVLNGSDPELEVEYSAEWIQAENAPESDFKS